MFFFLYLLIFILCAQDNRSNGVLEVVGGDLVSPNYWYHSKYGMPGHAYNNWYWSISIQSQQMVSELMVFVQDSSALDEAENVKLIEFGRGIKTKKTTRKFRFVLR